MMRSLFDAVASRNAPIAPGGDSQGFLLRDLAERECRFPTFRDHEGTRFCAMEVEPDVWRRADLNGSYCEFHRQFLSRQPPVSVDDREVG